MKCPFCNTDIEEGSLYCNHCGSPMQVVPDFNVLEDDVLPSMLDSSKKKKVSSVQKQDNSPKHNKKIFAVLFLCTALILGLSVGVFYHTHTYQYYLSKAEGLYKEKDYNSAIGFYRKALEKEETYSAYLSLGKALEEVEYYDEAVEAYKKAYDLNPKNEEVITQLALLYSNTDNYEALEEMLSWDLTDEEISIVNEYGIFAPVFSLPGGTYNDDVEVVLSGKEGYHIYYTLDGTQPSSHNGKLYEKPIEISKQGNTILSAVCVSEDGKYGVVASENYEITYVAPPEPVLSPTGGRITKETYITITTDSSDAKIYYTWDGSLPTTNSMVYTNPILVPEGNNVLSVIVVDKHGMSSSVVKGNYIYYP